MGGISPQTVRELRSKFASRLSEIYRAHSYAVEAGGHSWSSCLQKEVPSSATELSSSLRSGVEQLRAIGLISEDNWLDACVEYHNQHRLFDASVLLGSDWPRHVGSSSTPLTIARALALTANPSPSVAAAQGTKRIGVSSKRYHADRTYRESEQRDARAKADASGARVMLVNEAGIPLFDYLPNARDFKGPKRG